MSCMRTLCLLSASGRNIVRCPACAPPSHCRCSYRSGHSRAVNRCPDLHRVLQRGLQYLIPTVGGLSCVQPSRPTQSRNVSRALTRRSASATSALPIVLIPRGHAPARPFSRMIQQAHLTRVPRLRSAKEIARVSGILARSRDRRVPRAGLPIELNSVRKWPRQPESLGRDLSGDRTARTVSRYSCEKH
jgi:hypothetical protein